MYTPPSAYQLQHPYIHPHSQLTRRADRQRHARLQRRQVPELRRHAVRLVEAGRHIRKGLASRPDRAPLRRARRPPGIKPPLLYLHTIPAHLHDINEATIQICRPASIRITLLHSIVIHIHLRLLLFPIAFHPSSPVPINPIPSVLPLRTTSLFLRFILPAPLPQHTPLPTRHTLQSRRRGERGRCTGALGAWRGGEDGGLETAGWCGVGAVRCGEGGGGGRLLKGAVELGEGVGFAARCAPSPNQPSHAQPPSFFPSAHPLPTPDAIDTESPTHHRLPKNLHAIQLPQRLRTSVNIAEQNVRLSAHLHRLERDNVEDRAVGAEEHVQ
ncbi:hypothetical protein M8818_005070 [Zalaria obscura]|uniref:Uncharacterized protein n=1 Tax=Zalaria obscura TaxID=2024903 RepID=A0ACC3SAF8_9PEZI